MDSLLPSGNQLTLPVPAAEKEEHLWVPQRVPGTSRREMQRQRGNYESTLPARLAEWEPQISGALSAEIDEATQALVGFDTYSVLRLGRQSTALGPMSAVLLRTESASSSEIEQLTSSPKQLALADIDERSGVNAQTIVGNVRAMEAAVQLAEEVTEETVLAMHRELLSRQPGGQTFAGQYRNQIVWIGRGTAGPVLADFVAPQPEHVPTLMEDLMVFAARSDLPAMLQVAVAHAQFETIHPFVDGNGRTGRALVQSMLRNKGVTTQVTLPISAGLLTDTERYFAALGRFREGDAGPIAELFAWSARFAAVTGRELIDGLADELSLAEEKLAGVRPQSRVWDVLPLLLAHPVVNARFLEAKLGLHGTVVRRTLDQLVERGVLREVSGRSRNRLWQHDGVLGLLADYAEKVRRHRFVGW